MLRESPPCPGGQRCQPPLGTYPVTGKTLHQAEDRAIEDVRDDTAVALLLPPPATSVWHLGWEHSTGLGQPPPTPAWQAQAQTQTMASSATVAPSVYTLHPLTP